MATTQLPIQGVFDSGNGELVGFAVPGGQKQYTAGNGSARLTVPDLYVEPAPSRETITVAWGPSADAAANSEYASLGTPSYRFDQAANLNNSLRRVELDGILRADRVEEGFGTRLDFSLGAVSTTPYFVQGAAPGAIRFVTSSPNVTLVSYPNSTLKCRILVDGAVVSGADVAGVLTGPVATGGGRPNWIKLTFPDARPRVISYGAPNIKSIFVDSGYYIAPPYTQRPKLLVAGDSFAVRFGATGEVTPFGSLAILAGRACGMSTVNIAQGGSGWVSTNGGVRYNYRQGLAWLAANAPSYKPDYLLLWSTGNDWDFRADLQSQVTATIREALTYWPDIKQIMVTGVYGGFNTESMALDLSRRVKAGFDAVEDDRVVYIPTCASETSDPLYTGTGSVPSPANDGGNADIYFSNASQGAGDRHPNRAGVLYGADWLARRIYASAAGTPL